MKVYHTSRNFEVVTHPLSKNSRELADNPRLVQQSSAIGNYPDALERPGSSALWVGEHHHLDREEVAELVGRLRRWLETGSLTSCEDERAALAAARPEGGN